MMGSFTGTPDRSERAKAIVALAAVHAALAALILSGLDVRTIKRAVERLQMIDVELSPPPPLPTVDPPPKPKPDRARLDEGAAGKKAEPTEIVAPKTPLPVPSPATAAPIAGSGNAPSAGAAPAGPGTGAGGAGNGRGGGGSGDYSGYTPARLVRNLSRADYRRIAANRSPAGNAAMALAISASGEVEGCRVIRSSGDASIDGVLCPLVRDRLRFRPALDDRGRPIPYRLTYVATWDR